MRYDDFDADSVFDEFVRIAERDGLSSKKANYTMPTDSLFKEAHGLELDISDELSKIAEKELGGKDILDQAHPEGSKPLSGVDAKDDLALIEDLKGLKKRMLDLVNKEMKAKASRIAVEVIKFAEELESSGLSKMAAKFDRIGEILVLAQEGEMLDAAMAKARDNVSALFESLNIQRDRLSEGDLSKVMTAGENAMDALSKASQALNNFNFVAAEQALEGAKNHLNGFWYWSADVHVYMNESLYKSALANIDKAVDVISMKAREPEVTDTPQVAKVDKAKRSMLAVQKAANKLLKDLGMSERVAENGNPGDKETYMKLKNLFGLEPGRDYRNWDQMMRALKAKGQEMLATRKEVKEESKAPDKPQQELPLGFRSSPAGQRLVER